MAVEKQNPIVRAMSFGRESLAELKQVHAPTKQETIQMTIAVLMMVALFGTFLGMVDWGIGRLIKAILT